jgi:hypothetical protein
MAKQSSMFVKNNFVQASLIFACGARGCEVLVVCEQLVNDLEMNLNNIGINVFGI